jgi:hypothetical protein
VLSVFLNAQNKCTTPAATNVACIEYPNIDPKQHGRGTRFVCVQKVPLLCSADEDCLVCSSVDG